MEKYLFGAAVGILIGLLLNRSTMFHYTIIKKLNKIIMTQEQAVEKLNAVATQLAKVKSEVQALVDAAQNEDEISPALQAAIDNVSAATQGVDDLNEDAPTEETE